MAFGPGWRRKISAALRRPSAGAFILQLRPFLSCNIFVSSSTGNFSTSSLLSCATMIYQHVQYHCLHRMVHEDESLISLSSLSDGVWSFNNANAVVLAALCDRSAVLEKKGFARISSRLTAGVREWTVIIAHCADHVTLDLPLSVPTHCVLRSVLCSMCSFPMFAFDVVCACSYEVCMVDAVCVGAQLGQIHSATAKSFHPFAANSSL